MTDAADFEWIERELSTSGADAVCERLAERFREEKRFHELFDTRLAQCRLRLGLSLYGPSDLEQVPEALRDPLEQGYLAACREVGELLLKENRIRQAWLYLRPAGEVGWVRLALEEATPSDENYEELIEVALYERVAPELGFRWVLDHYGTCNAITTFESVAHSLDTAQQQRAAAVLLRQLHADLLSNVRTDLFGDPPQPPEAAAASMVSELLVGVEGTFGEYCCHIDVSHLGSVVRYSRLLTDANELQLARDLTEYGRRLHANFQYAGEEPFVDLFDAHGLFFAAQLGERVDEAVAFFRERAATIDPQEQGTAAIEVLAVLLARLGRHTEAMQALAQLPPGASTSRFAPSLVDLARQSADFNTLRDICRNRGDLLGFALGSMEERQRGQT